jgi:quercetin dioxygenase-like cupin family protein
MAARALIAEPLGRIRPAEIDWEPLGTHGLRRKRLGFDPESGHVTALVEIPRGWHGGGIAHFHHAFEEVFILAGSVTVGGKHYWHAGDYFFRPAQVVHGHDERAEEGATALIRSDGPLELLLIHEPEQADEYPLPAYYDGRGHLYSLPTEQVAWIADPAFPDGWKIRPLSTDAHSGARTVMVEIPAGWQASGSARPAAWEASVLDGGLEGEKAEFIAGDYSAGPAGTEVFGVKASAGGCRFILWLFAPGPA